MTVMSFEQFEYIMNQIKAHSEKLERVSDFFEKELCSDSWCLVNVGEEIIVDREREIEAFVPEEYWLLDVILEKNLLSLNQDSILHLEVLL